MAGWKTQTIERKIICKCIVRDSFGIGPLIPTWHHKSKLSQKYHVVYCGNLTGVQGAQDNAKLWSMLRRWKLLSDGSVLKLCLQFIPFIMFHPSFKQELFRCHSWHLETRIVQCFALLPHLCMIFPLRPPFNVSKATVNHPWVYHFHAWYKPSNHQSTGGLRLLY